LGKSGSISSFNGCFSNHDLSFVVNLSGRAELFLRDSETMKQVWTQITDKSRAFFLVEGPGFAVIHTRVEMIECTIPRKMLSFLIDPGELKFRFRHSGELCSLRMKNSSLDEWRAYLLAKAREYRIESKKQRPAITISRETGAAAITIGQMVTESFQST
jgi:hypothetical protein